MGKNAKAVTDCFPRIEEIADSQLRDQVCQVWLQAWQASDYRHLEDASQWEPARDALGISNVAHTNGVVELSLAMGEALHSTQSLPVDRDVLIAAAVLHDVDKIRLFHAADGRPTDLGRQLGHVATGVHLAMQAGLPLAVVHAIAAHSPNYSKVAPQTVEAVILRQADDLFTRTWIMQRGQTVSFEMR
jgi:7,8-dihydroneopterin 2',3'-cyclic phosphate phosphodiesterase